MQDAKEPVQVVNVMCATQDALTDLGLEMTDHSNKFSSYWCSQLRGLYA